MRTRSWRSSARPCAPQDVCACLRRRRLAGARDRPELQRLLDHLRAGDGGMEAGPPVALAEGPAAQHGADRPSRRRVQVGDRANRHHAESERAMIRERTSADLAAARAEGRIGGPRNVLDDAKRREIAEAVMSGRRTAAHLASATRNHLLPLDQSSGPSTKSRASGHKRPEAQGKRGLSPQGLRPTSCSRVADPFLQMRSAGTNRTCPNLYWRSRRLNGPEQRVICLLANSGALFPYRQQRNGHAGGRETRRARHCEPLAPRHGASSNSQYGTYIPGEQRSFAASPSRAATRRRGSH